MGTKYCAKSVRKREEIVLDSVEMDHHNGVVAFRNIGSPRACTVMTAQRADISYRKFEKS